MENKKAAFEMSMTTIIVIVLSVSFLILGLILIRNIYGTATKSIDTIDQKLGSELQRILTDEAQNLVIYLGETRTAQIRAGTSNFGVLIAAQTINGNPITKESDLQYNVSLVDSGSMSSCIKLITKTRTIGFFNDKLGVWLDSYDFDKSISRKIIYITIPADTPVCTQQVRVTAVDRTANPEGDILASQVFTIQVLKKGLF